MFSVFLLGQLREQLSYLKGDNFFRLTCSDCSEDGKEHYERLKLTWQQVSEKFLADSGLIPGTMWFPTASQATTLTDP